MGVYIYTLPASKKDGVVIRPETKMYRVACRIKNADGTEKQICKRGFKGKKEAQRYEQQIKQEIAMQSNEYMDGLFDAFLQDGKARLKPSTYEMRSFTVEKHLRPYFGKMRVSDVTPMVVRKWQNSLLDREKKYSQTYLRSLNSRLSSVMNYGVKYHGIALNSVKLCDTIGKARREEINFWTYEEFQKFISTFTDDCPWWRTTQAPIIVFRTAYNLLFYSGIREGELLGLTINDIDFEQNLININKTYFKKWGEEMLLPPKTPKSKRKIELPVFVMDMLKELIEKLPSQGGGQRIFGFLSKDALNRVVKIHAKKAGVKQIRVHDFRHSCATNLAFAGVSFQVIQERLGHEKLSTTLDIYSHLIKPDKDAAVEAFNKMTGNISAEKTTSDNNLTTNRL